MIIKGANESVTRVDSSVPLMHHDPSDLVSLILIQIIPKECTLSVFHSSVIVTTFSIDSLNLSLKLQLVLIGTNQTDVITSMARDLQWLPVNALF